MVFPEFSRKETLSLSLSYLKVRSKDTVPEMNVAKLLPGQETLKLLGTLELLGTAERERNRHQRRQSRETEKLGRWRLSC